MRKRLVSLACLVIVLGAWAAFLRPTFLGGNASYVMVTGMSMEPRMHTGDLVITTREDGYAPRDVIAFRVPEGQPAAGATVIHRITGGNGTDGYVTKGDNRELADDWRPRYADVQGRMWLMVPKGGSAIAFLRSPLAIALAAGIAVFLVIVFDGSTSEKLRRRERGQDDARAAVDDPRTPDPRRSTELRYKL